MKRFFERKFKELLEIPIGAQVQGAYWERVLPYLILSVILWKHDLKPVFGRKVKMGRPFSHFKTEVWA
ncbi:hypothetical protein C4Q31_00950 [Leptospira borgpetersenii serovar Ceylonica]|nr:hypothetical protein C4Q31_00950 [Leptospira borgpetersenii serovar Ceylonica]